MPTTAADAAAQPPAAPREAVLWALVAAATLLAFGVRLYRIDHPAPWLDEATTLLLAQQPWGRIFGDLREVDIHPPLYTTLQKLWIEHVAGPSRTGARLLPVLFGTACVPLLFVLVRRLLDARVALIAAFLLTTAPLHVHHSRELRMYSLACLLALVALIGLVFAVRPAAHAGASASERANWRAWALYTAGAAAAFYAHNSLLLLPALAALCVAALWWMGRMDRAQVMRFVVASVLVGLAMLPWLATLNRHADDAIAAEYGWIPVPPTWAWTRSQWLGAYPYAPWLKVVMFLLALAGAWWLWRRRRDVLAFAAAFVAGQPLAMWLLNFMRPVLLVRGLVWPTMLFTILPAALLARLRDRWAAPATALLVAAQATALAPDYPREFKPTDAEGLAAPLSQLRPQTDLLVLHSVYAEPDLRLTVPQAFAGRSIAVHTRRDYHLQALHKAPPTLVADLVAAVGDAKRLWLVEDGDPERMRALKALGTPLGSWTSGELRLTLIERR